MKTLGIVPGVIVETSDGMKAEVICTFADGRVLASGRYYNYLELTAVEPEAVEAEKGAITSTEVAIEVAMLPEILADDCEPLAQTLDLINGEAKQEKLAYFVQALQDAIPFS